MTEGNLVRLQWPSHFPDVGDVAIGVFVFVFGTRCILLCGTTALLCAAALLWHNSPSVAQQPFCGAAALLWHNSPSVRSGPFVAQQPFCGAAAILWHNNPCVAQRPFCGPSAQLRPRPPPLINSSERDRGRCLHDA